VWQNSLVSDVTAVVSQRGKTEAHGEQEKKVKTSFSSSGWPGIPLCTAIHSSGMRHVP